MQLFYKFIKTKITSLLMDYNAKLKGAITDLVPERKTENLVPRAAAKVAAFFAYLFLPTVNGSMYSLSEFGLPLQCSLSLSVAYPRPINISIKNA